MNERTLKGQLCLADMCSAPYSNQQSKARLLRAGRAGGGDSFVSSLLFLGGVRAQSQGRACLWDMWVKAASEIEALEDQAAQHLPSQVAASAL